MKTDKLQESNNELESNNEILIYYQSTIRNVALTSILAFAALTYSRVFIKKSIIYSSGLVLVAVLILIASHILNMNLYNMINNNYKNDKTFTSSNNFLTINILFIISHIIMILFASVTFFKIITNNKLK